MPRLDHSAAWTRVALALAVAAAGAAPEAWATMDSATLANLVKSRKLGLSPEETDAAMVRLRGGAVPSNLNRSASAKAIKGLASMAVSEGRSPFDGNEAVPRQNFEAAGYKIQGHAIDQDTGEKAEFTQELK